jgi:iron complex outermembrane recepter protein
MKSLIITIFAICCIINNSFAQTGQLKGIATNNEGKPAPYISIQLKETKKGTSSDENGNFIITNLKANTYTLVASFVGYKTLVQQINIEEGKTLNLALQLIENTEDLKEIVVKGYVSPNERILTIGKVGIKPMDLPQSVMTIDRHALENQQVLRVSDVLMNTNGVYIMGTTGGYQEEIAGRGFAFGSSNTFKNGIRYFNGMMTEMSGVERVEIIKGSAAILFGNVAAGGILNFITKKPKADFGGEISMRSGSFGLLKPMIDVYGGIGKSKKLAYRFNGSYEKANSFREGVNAERFYVNPSLLYKIGKKTEVLIEADYMKDNRTADFGAGIINYQIVNLPRERFLGVPWSYYQSEQVSTTATLTHRFSDNWKVSLTGAYRQYATDLFANTRPNQGTLISKEGMWIRNIQRSEVAEAYYLAQLDITGKFKTGSLSHQLLLGIDADQFETKTTAYNQLARYDTVNVFGTKQYKTRTDIPILTPATLTTAPVSRMGVYVQDLLHITNYLKILAGVRYSYQQTGSNVYTYSSKTTTDITTFAGAFSPRLGLVYQPNQKHSVFASYANSFAINTGVDISGNALAPSIIDQYELGIKNQLMNGKLSANITAYRILNDNLAQISLANGNTNTNIKELAGAVQSEGIEFDVVARPINGLALMAGYSYNETKYVKSNTYIAGSFLTYNPKHTANASANYRFDKGMLKNLSVGLNSVYIGQRFAGRPTRVQVANDAYRLTTLPAYTQIDATIGYTLGRVSLRGKVGNIFDVLSYNVHDDNSVNPITPRNYSISLQVKF